MTLSVDLAETRYDRQERITWWEQDLLGRARILVVGAGAIGNEVVKNLALLGIGSVVVVDFDAIELSNLSRCVFFRHEDEGRSKAETVAARAMELNPASKVCGLQRDVRTFGTGIGRRADLVVGALDNREARLFLNRMAWRVGRPWLDGAIEALSGVARVFSPPTSCYECTLSETDFEILSHRQSCALLTKEGILEGKVPTTATTSSIVGGLLVQEVVKLIHRDRDGVTPLDGGAVIDGANNDLYVIRYPFDENCQAHHIFADPIPFEGGLGSTPADICAAAGFEAGIVEFGDDHLVSWRCPRCETVDDRYALVPMLTFADAECPACGEPRQPNTTTGVQVPGDHAELTLHDLAVRHDEILAVRQGSAYRYVWVRDPDPDLPEDWR